MYQSMALHRSRVGNMRQGPRSYTSRVGNMYRSMALHMSRTGNMRQGPRSYRSPVGNMYRSMAIHRSRLGSLRQGPRSYGSPVGNSGWPRYLGPTDHELETWARGLGLVDQVPETYTDAAPVPPYRSSCPERADASDCTRYRPLIQMRGDDYTPCINHTECSAQSPRSRRLRIEN